MLSRRTRRKIKNAAELILRAPGSRAFRRAAALIICFALCLGVMPAGAYAAVTQWTDYADDLYTTSGGSNGNPLTDEEKDDDPLNIGDPDDIDLGNLSDVSGTEIVYDYSPRETGGNYYALEVSSGSRTGGGYAENVLYFSIYYTDVNNTKRSVLLFPGIDAVTNSYNAVGTMALQLVRSKVRSLFCCTLPDISSNKALGPVSSDQLIFETPEKVKTIDEIKIFGKRTVGSSDWACQGMRVLEISAFCGARMYGWYSDDTFSDYNGTVIAEAVMASGGGVFRWDSTGGTFSITPDTGTAKDITLVRTVDKENYESAHHTTTHVGYEHKSSTGHNVVFRIELADQGGAGFESLAAEYANGSSPKISELNLPEVAMLDVRYKDVYGALRDVRLPLVINSLGQVINTMGDISIAGFAQQGDSIAMPAYLPDFADIDKLSVVLGTNRALADSNITISSTDTDRLNAMNQRSALSETDSINYLCIAVYDDVDVQVGLEGAVLRYKYEAGENNPVCYSTATSIDGLALSPGNATSISLQSYNSKMTLLPVDRMERYIVTLSTDNIANAGTTGDLKIQFNYTNLSDHEINSPQYSIKDYVTSFYGNWPGNVEDFAYKYGLRTGGTVQFIIPLQNVKKFNSVSFKLDGEDEWQFSGINVAMIKQNGVSPRSAEWKELTSSETDANGNPRFKSHILYSRNVETQPICFSIGNVYENEEDRPDPGSEAWEPGALVQDTDEAWEFNGDGENVSKKEDIDWTELANSMTYEEALQDLGFTKQRVNYKVIVHVAGDKVNSSDDDCGSKNLFYFQLVFENGKSGCTLANQQIEGDAFRTGTDTVFYIPCSQDYGELQVIRVIPDDQDSNADIYDKLKIKSIDVEKQSDSYLSPVWTASDAGEDGLGWVGIDYRDQGEIGSNTGARGRSLSEIATSYQITESSYDAKFLVAITTGGYTMSNSVDESGQPSVYPTYTGGMHMSYNYFDLNGVYKSVEHIDIVSLMNDYAARSSSYDRHTNVENENLTVNYAVSDPNYNFRGNTTDMFYITVKDISQFVSLSLQLRGDVATHWNITDVKIYLVNGIGTRYLNSNGEYDYKYAEGAGPELVSQWTQKDGIDVLVSVFRSAQNTSIAEVRNIVLDSSKIELSESSWKSTITREPKSKDDVFNLFIYPQAESDESVDPDSYTLKAAVRYKDARNLQTMQSSAGVLRKSYDDDGNLECFYALGIGGNNVDTILGVDVETNSLKAIRAPLTYGVLQQVRSGVLIESYTLNGVGNADLGDTMNISTSARDKTKQKLLLQLSGDTAYQMLDAEAKDLAVALHITTDDPSGAELRSKYVYLTDMGYTSIGPNQLLELDMSLGRISSINGISLVSIGNLNLTVDNIMVADLGTGGTVLNSFSFRGPVTPDKIQQRIGANGIVSVLNLDIVTAKDESNISSGTAGPVAMTIGYYDSYGALREEYYGDIRDFIESGEGFAAGGTDTIRMLIPELAEIRWIEFEPTSDAGSVSGTPATWKPESISASVGVDGRAVSRNINELIIEGSPLRIGMAQVLLSGTVSLADETSESTSAAGEEVSSGSSLSKLLSSGQTLDLSTIIYGSAEGIGYKLESYDPSSGATASVKLSATHSYTDDYLKQIYSSAKASANSPSSIGEELAAERVMEIVSDMQNSAGAFEDNDSYASFTAPRNYTGRNLYYRLTFYSLELPDIYYTVDITVYPESDLLPDAISVWKTEQSNALQSDLSDAVSNSTNNSSSSSSSSDESSDTSSDDSSDSTGSGDGGSDG